MKLTFIRSYIKNIFKITPQVILIFTLSLNSYSQFIINGSASDLGGGEYLLTPAQKAKVGTIWSDQKISLASSFEVELEVYFGTSNAGADGITFSLQPKSNTVGVSGGGLGIGGITPSLITEMDTYQNGSYGDPSFDHIALTKNTVDHKGSDNLVTPVRIINGKDNVEDGAWYNFKASWDASTKVYQVTINGATRIFYQGDIVNTIFGGDPNVYWGFTASTGGKHNTQKVRIINTDIIDIYQCTETPNDQTFCPKNGAIAVNLSIGNTQSSTTYQWYDSPKKDNLLGTGTSFTTPPISDNTDFYVLATTSGGPSTATIGPSPSGTLTDIWDVNYMAGYDRKFTAHVPIKINSVELNHPAWTGGCGAIGTSKIAEIDIYTSGGTLQATKVVNAACGETAPVPLGFDLPAGNYTMKLRGIVGGTFKLNNDGSEKTIPGIITLENNNITGPGGALPYSSVFFNWNINGGTGTSECLLSVKAEKDCPPCSNYPTVNLEPNFTYCNNSDTTITVNTTASNILWNTGETTKTIRVTEGTFTVSAWNDKTCETLGNITVSKECLPNLVLVDTVTICSGVTNNIIANGVQTGFWDGTDAFTQLSDSVIEVNLQADAQYYISNYTKLNILSDNINFEQPVICASNCFKIVDASTVPGWNTTASDNKVEIWSAGFQGVQPYSGKQFMELNANMNAALYQDVPTVPGQLMGVNLAHRGRGGTDEMKLLAGPPGGPYKDIKSYSDGLTWGYYTDYYRVPAGQTTTRFLFETVSCNGGPCGGSGNFLDAIEFFKLREEYDTVHVKVNKSPLVDLGRDSTFCNDIDFTLDAGNPGASYIWSTNESTQKIKVTSQGTYSVTVEQNGCKESSDIVVTKKFCACTPPKMPTINGVSGDTVSSIYLDYTQAVNKTVPSLLAGKTYRVLVSGTWSAWSNNPANNVVDGAFRYKEKNASADITPLELTSWAFNGSTTHRPYPNTYNTNHNYWFYLQSTGNDVITFSDPQYTDNNGGLNLEFFQLPDTVRVCQSNTTTNLSNFVIGQNILWYSSPIGGTGSSTTPVINNNSIGITQYWVSQTINGCESERTPLTYKVQASPTYNIQNLTPEICEGDSAQIIVKFTGKAPYNVYYTSSLSGVNSKLSIINDSTIIKAFQTDIIKIDSIEDANCSTLDTTSTSINVKNLPTIIGNNSSRCDTGEVILKAISTTTGIINWYADSIGGTSLGTGTTFKTPTLDSTTTFYSQSFDSGCKSKRMPISAIITLPPSVNLGDDTTICEGSEILLNAKNLGATFLWNTSQTSSSIKVGDTGTYKVKVTSINNCSTEDSIRINIRNNPKIDLGNDTTICKEKTLLLDATNINSTYKWNTTATTPTLQVSTAGTYSVLVTDNLGCKKSDTIHVNTDIIPSINLGNDTTLCEGNSLLLDPKVVGYTFEWSNSKGSISNQQTLLVSNPETYIITISTIHNCSTSDTLVLYSRKNPKVNLGPDTVLCKDQIIVLNAGNTSLTHLWNTSNTGPTLQVSKSGNYSVLVTDDIGCNSTDTINIQIHRPFIDLGKDITICQGTNLELDAGPTNYNILWSTNKASRTINVSKSGAYSARVSYSPTCYSEDTILVSVQDNPQVDLGDDITFFETDLYILDAKNTGLFYNWNTNETTQTIDASAGGLYSVTVTDSIGCVGYDDILISIKKRVIIPYTFSPNGDGINDVWEIEGLDGYPNATVNIFNRWGNLVYTQKGEYQPWNGERKGKEATEGVYFYVISLNDIDKQVISGPITILR